MDNKRFVLALFIALTAAGTSAGANTICEAEVLTRSGRTFLNLIRSGLKTGDLAAGDLERVRASEKPESPVGNEREITNHSLRGGFIRALKRMRPGEWPTVRLELQKILERLAKQQAAVQEAKLDTKSLFELKPVKFVFEEHEHPQRTLVSSTGEVYFLTEGGKSSFLREFHSGLQFPWPAKNIFGRDIREFPNEGVLVATLDNERNLRVIRASDQKTVFNMKLSDIEGIDSFKSGQPPTDLKLFLVKGRIKILVLETAQVMMGKALLRHGIVMDLRTKRYERVEFPNVLLQYTIGPNGHLYIAGSGLERGIQKNIGFIRNLTTGTPEYSHEYVHDVHNFSSLVPQIMFDGNGIPRMYYRKPSSDFNLFRAVGDTDRLAQLRNVGPVRMTSYLDPRGRMHYASVVTSDPEVIGAEQLEFGDLENPSIAQLPLLTSLYRQVNVVDTFYGKMVLLWGASVEGIEEGYISNFQDSWINLRVPRAKFKSAGDPFYDPRTKSTFVFLQTLDNQWELMKIYGRYGEE